MGFKLVFGFGPELVGPFTTLCLQAQQHRAGPRKLVTEVEPISGRVDRVSATEMVDLRSISDRVKAKTIKIRIHSLLLNVQQLGTV